MFSCISVGKRERKEGELGEEQREDRGGFIEGQEEQEQHLKAKKAAGISCNIFEGSLLLLSIFDYICVIMSRLG